MATDSITATTSQVPSKYFFCLTPLFLASEDSSAKSGHYLDIPLRKGYRSFFPLLGSWVGTHADVFRIRDC
jgi:hypothetical protein